MPTIAVAVTVGVGSSSGKAIGAGIVTVAGAEDGEWTSPRAGSGSAGG